MRGGVHQRRSSWAPSSHRGRQSAVVVTFVGPVEGGQPQASVDEVIEINVFWPGPGLVISGGRPFEIAGRRRSWCSTLSTGRDDGAWTLETSRSWSRSFSTRPGTN